MDSFKILVICWTVVWASAIRTLGDVSIQYNGKQAALLQMLVGHPTQAWTSLPAYAFVVWALGCLGIRICLKLARWLAKAEASLGRVDYAENEHKGQGKVQEPEKQKGK